MKFKVGQKVADIDMPSWGIGEVVDIDTKRLCTKITVLFKKGWGRVEYFEEDAETDLILYKPNNRGKNKRGKDGRFIKEVNKEDVLNNHELRLRRIEQYLDLDK